MTREFLENMLDKCHEGIASNEPYGVVEILKTIKLRVHDPVVGDRIKEFEREADQLYDERCANNERLDKNSNEISRLNGMEYMKLARKYLSFYDKLMKEYELL